jgi:hypothetical protein
VAAGVREATGRAHDASGGGVRFGLEGVGLGRFGEVAVEAEHIEDGLTAGRVASNARGAVVSVRDAMNMKATTKTGAAPLAYLCDGVHGAAKGSSYRVEKGAHGLPVEAAGVI